MAREPDWSVLPGDVPPAILVLVRRCLERDRRKRMADISTAGVLIDEQSALSAAPGPQALAHTRDQIEAAVAATRSVRRRVSLAAAATLIVGSIITGSAVWWAMRPAPPRVVRAEVPTTGRRRWPSSTPIEMSSSRPTDHVCCSDSRS
jgi:hypothetical protein